MAEYHRLGDNYKSESSEAEDDEKELDVGSNCRRSSRKSSKNDKSQRMQRPRRSSNVLKVDPDEWREKYVEIKAPLLLILIFIVYLLDALIWCTSCGKVVIRSHSESLSTCCCTRTTPNLSTLLWILAQSESNLRLAIMTAHLNSLKMSN